MQQVVSAIIVQQKRVLLGLRKNTSVYSGCWSLPVGHVEAGETDDQAILRELKEELGIEATRFKAIDRLQDKAGKIDHRVYLLQAWQNKIENKEPLLCERLAFFSLDQLAENTTPISLTILERHASLLK